MDRAELQIVDLLGEILSELRAIRGGLSKNSSTSEAGIFEDLLPAVGTGAFTAADLVDLACDADEQKLRAAILPLLGETPENGVRRLGRFLARHAGESAGNLRLERVGRSGHGEKYRVIQMPESNIRPRRHTL